MQQEKHGLVESSSTAAFSLPIPFSTDSLLDGWAVAPFDVES